MKRCQINRPAKYLLVGAWISVSIVALAQDDDSYTRYEMLDPASQSFRILYDVSATRPGATYYYNTLRKAATTR